MNKFIHFALLFVCFAAVLSCNHRQLAGEELVTEQYNQLKQASSPAEIESAKDWFRDSLDLALLDSLTFRDDYIRSWTGLYMKSLSPQVFDAEMIADAKEVIGRAAVQSPKTVKPLVHTLVETLAQQNRFAAAAAIAAYPHGIEIEPGEYSEIAQRLLIATLLPGNRAPAIEGIKPFTTPPTVTLLLFYESGCENCALIIGDLIKHYPALQSKGVRVITVSSDVDEGSFKEYAASFPWKDVLCDFRSFSGENFKRYGVAATPTLFLIDAKGIVTGQYATLAETGVLN